MSEKKITVDFVGKIGEQSGIGNYATKLFHELDDIEDFKLRKKEPSWNFPILHRIDVINSKLQNFIEVPYKVLKSDSDIVYLPSQRKTSGLFFLPKKNIRNVVATIHDIGPYVNNYMGKPTQFLSHFYIRAIKKLDNIISISKATTEELQKELDIDKEKITTIYQGVDQEYFQPEQRKNEKLERYNIEGHYILYIGSEIPRKNLEDTMNLFSKLQQQNPELTLINAGHAGSQKYREKTLQAMQENNLEKGEDVIFTGFVDEKDLPQVYSSAEATLLLSHYEGLGRSLLESLACGTPVLANNIAPMNEILPEHMLLNPDNQEEFINKYQNRTENPKQNREIIKEYTWERTAKQTAEVFKNVG